MSGWSSDVCSSDLPTRRSPPRRRTWPARPNSTPWSPISRASASTHHAGTDMVSGIFTLILLLLFVALWAWAWQPRKRRDFDEAARLRSEEHTSELQSLMRISYAVFCLKNKNIHQITYFEP